MRFSIARLFQFQILALILSVCAAPAVIRDGGIDPANLGKGDWIYSIQDCTNKLGGHISSVTNENSLMLFYKSQGIRYVIVKTGTGASLYNACYGFPQLTSNFINVAHANGILVFGYNRSFATNVAGEVAIADFVFNRGADGFVWDAEAEWESSVPGVGANGPSLAWQQCSQVRSNWPNKFLAHAPFPIIYFHSSFPYKEFGFWSDAVMPQIYHLSSTGLRSSPSATINWTDVNWKTWQDSLASTPGGNSNGVIVNWTNAIKPIIPVQDVYATTLAGNLPCNSPASVHPDEDVTEFIDYCSADPNTQTVGGYKGINFWRADLHGSAQWTNMKTGTVGNFAGTVNNIVMDDSRATFTGGWNHVLVFSATTTLPTYTGATGSDTNSFGTNYFSKPQGNGSSYAQFTPNIITAGDYDVYQWHPFVTNASSGTPFVISHSFGTTTNFANQQTNSGNWSLLGRFNFATGTNGYVRVTDGFSDAGNVAIADGIKLVFATTNVNYSLTTSVIGSGTVAASPNQAGYAPGSVVTLTANPNAGYTLSGWSGDASGNTNPLTITMTTNKFITATFLNTNVDLFLDNTNSEVTFSSGWSSGTSSTDKYLADYRFASTASGGTATATYRPSIGTAGYYDVFIWYPQGSNRATNSPWLVSYSGGSTNVFVDQTGNGGGWRLIAAARPFNVGTDGFVLLSNDTGYSGKVVLADGVRFSFVSPLNSAPSISAQPLSQTVKIGSNVTFSVTANGIPTPAYQWRFNNTNIPGATATTYIRSNAQFANAGNYSVLVTNIAGSIASSNAVLTVLPLAPLWFQSITPLPDGKMMLVVTGEPGYACSIDRSTNFADWQLITNLMNTNGTSSFTDSSATNSTSGFYRARQ